MGDVIDRRARRIQLRQLKTKTWLCADFWWLRKSEFPALADERRRVVGYWFGAAERGPNLETAFHMLLSGLAEDTK